MRELRVDDGEAVAALIKDANPHRQVDAEEVRSWLRQPWLDADDLRVLDDGDVVGYIDLDLRGDIAYLDPSGPGREDELLEWGERRARERGAAKVRLPIWEGQDALGEVATRRGYSRVRASFELLLELGDEPPAGPAWPDGIEVRTYRHTE